MAKGIIVVDVPDECENCLFSKRHAVPLQDYSFCSILTRGVIQDGKKRPDWCPIKEAPKKSEVVPLGEKSYVSGWNACINEVLKGVH